VFTARYALSPYIKQIGFVFKGLREACSKTEEAMGYFRSSEPLYNYYASIQYGQQDVFSGYKAILKPKMQAGAKTMLSSLLEDAN
jgi:hypothetical protein